MDLLVRLKDTGFLHDAVRYGRRWPVDLLIKHGANVADKDFKGWDALFTAVCLDNMDLARVLLEKHRAIANTKNLSGLDALHIAVYTGRLDMVMLLIEYGSEIWNMDDPGEKVFE
ncbi:ankyrin repeat-containing domain protein [Baffinella frigidus]|nr:ankyrin repeat-containing domain protein [Cryptophyta sp. CCMP2293]